MMIMNINIIIDPIENDQIDQFNVSQFDKHINTQIHSID